MLARPPVLAEGLHSNKNIIGAPFAPVTEGTAHLEGFPMGPLDPIHTNYVPDAE